MRKALLALFALCSLGALASAQAPGSAVPPARSSADAASERTARVERVRSHLEFLCSDELEGRAAGSPGARRAADYVEARFEEMGLKTEARDFGGKYRNVIATIPSGGGRAILIGAHYDHLGKRLGSVYPGADDNASGVAALIEAGRILASLEPGYDVVLAAFDGEEIGLLGSREFARSYSGKPIALMLSLDMVGHLRDEARLLYEGTGAIRGGAELVRGVRAPGVSAKCSFRAADSGVMTDTYYFDRLGIPAFNVTTCLAESKYHTPQDDVASLDVEGVASVAEHVAAVVEAARGGIEPSGERLYGGGKPRAGLSLYLANGTIGGLSAGGSWTSGEGAELFGSLPAGFFLGFGNVSVLGGLRLERRASLGEAGASGALCLSPLLAVESSVRVAGLECDQRLGAYYRLEAEDGGRGLVQGFGALVDGEFLAFGTISPFNRVSLFFEASAGSGGIGPGGLSSARLELSLATGFRVRF